MSRKTLSMSILIVAACACTSQESTPMKPTSSSIATNAQLVRRVYDAINTRAFDALDALIAPDYPGVAGGAGPAAFATPIRGLVAAFPDIAYRIDHLVADADAVAVRWTWTGTYQAPFRAFQPTGKPVTNTGMAIFRIRDGRIASGTVETDRLGFLEQIGVVPPNVGLGPAPAASPAAAAATPPGR
jgi:steroid delta-isomerase-like uncharacterized protein